MEKLELIKTVLTSRLAITKRAYAMAEGYQRAWYDGKMSGYQDALDLLNSTEESIGVELTQGKPMRFVWNDVSELELIDRNGTETR